MKQNKEKKNNPDIFISIYKGKNSEWHIDSGDSVGTQKKNTKVSTLGGYYSDY